MEMLSRLELSYSDVAIKRRTYIQTNEHNEIDAQNER